VEGKNFLRKKYQNLPKWTATVIPVFPTGFAVDLFWDFQLDALPDHKDRATFIPD